MKGFSHVSQTQPFSNGASKHNASTFTSKSWKLLSQSLTLLSLRIALVIYGAASLFEVAECHRNVISPCEWSYSPVPIEFSIKLCKVTLWFFQHGVKPL